LKRPTLKNSPPQVEGIKGRGIKKVTIHPHPLNHVRFRALSCTPRGAGPALSPAFAEAASRRQASRERGNWIESISF